MSDIKQWLDDENSTNHTINKNNAKFYFFKSDDDMVGISISSNGKSMDEYMYDDEVSQYSSFDSLIDSIDLSALNESSIKKDTQGDKGKLFESKESYSKSDLARMLTINSTTGNEFSASDISNDVLKAFNDGWKAIYNKNKDFNPFEDDVEAEDIDVLDEFIDLLISLSSIDGKANLFESKAKKIDAKNLSESKVIRVKRFSRKLNENKINKNLLSYSKAKAVIKKTRNG